MPHERFADEDSTDAGGFETFDVGAIADSALADENHIGRDLVAEFQGVFEVGLERAEVAIVDANEIGPGGENARELIGIMEFDEGVHFEPMGAGEQGTEQLVVEDLGDEQDAVGSGHAGFHDLVFVDQEIFTEQREDDGGADAGEIGQVALEVRDVGENRETGRTVCLIGASDRDGVEIGANEAGGGAGFLDLGDESDGAGAGERGAKGTRRRGLNGLGLQLLDRHAETGSLDFAMLGGHDLVKDAWHELW